MAAMREFVVPLHIDPLSFPVHAAGTVRVCVSTAAGTCAVHTWCDGQTTSRYLDVHTLPEALAAIVVAGRLGGHTVQGAWGSRVWFDMTPTFELIHFLDGSKHYVS